MWTLVVTHSDRYDPEAWLTLTPATGSLSLPYNVWGAELGLDWISVCVQCISVPCAPAASMSQQERLRTFYIVLQDPGE